MLKQAVLPCLLRCPAHPHAFSREGAGNNALRTCRTLDLSGLWAVGIEAGLDADDLVAQELGKRRAKDLNPSLAAYKDKVKAKLQSVSPFATNYAHLSCSQSIALLMYALVTKQTCLKQRLHCLAAGPLWSC